MTYKNYEVTATIKSYDEWSVNDDGEAVDWMTGYDGIEITDYQFENAETSDTFYASDYIEASGELGELNGDTLRQLVDEHLQRAAR